MYIHIKSRGVIDQLPWSGQRDGWIYVKDRSWLGNCIQHSYPCFDFEFDGNGKLIEVHPWGKRKIKRLDAGIKPKARDWRHRHCKHSRLYCGRGETNGAV